MYVIENEWDHKKKIAKNVQIFLSKRSDTYPVQLFRILILQDPDPQHFLIVSVCSVSETLLCK